MALFIGRLPNDCRPRELESVFAKYGRLTRCDIKRGGYGFVEFEDPRDAEDAIKSCDGMRFLGERIVVEWAKGAKKRDNEECFKCGRAGHWAKSCPLLGSGSGSAPSGTAADSNGSRMTRDREYTRERSGRDRDRSRERFSGNSRSSRYGGDSYHSSSRRDYDQSDRRYENRDSRDYRDDRDYRGDRDDRNRGRESSVRRSTSPSNQQSKPNSATTTTTVSATAGGADVGGSPTYAARQSRSRSRSPPRNDFDRSPSPSASQ